jgi:antirestriction protein ArdC
MRMNATQTRNPTTVPDRSASALEHVPLLDGHPNHAIDRRRAGCSLSRESRLARDFGTTRFGYEGYAIEELVAELGAALLCADLDLTLEPREDHAAYIANWLDVLKADNRAIFTAASHAQRAADFIKACSPRPPPARGIRGSP